MQNGSYFVYKKIKNIIYFINKNKKIEFFYLYCFYYLYKY